VDCAHAISDGPAIARGIVRKNVCITCTTDGACSVSQSVSQSVRVSTLHLKSVPKPVPTIALFRTTWNKSDMLVYSSNYAFGFEQVRRSIAPEYLPNAGSGAKSDHCSSDIVRSKSFLASNCLRSDDDDWSTVASAHNMSARTMKSWKPKYIKVWPTARKVLEFIIYELPQLIGRKEEHFNSA
jgi:hypothetical protein